MEIVDYVNILNEEGRYKALYKMFGFDVIVAVQQDSIALRQIAAVPVRYAPAQLLPNLRRV